MSGCHSGWALSHVMLMHGDPTEPAPGAPPQERGRGEDFILHFISGLVVVTV